jgi:hypothetical protein
MHVLNPDMEAVTLYVSCMSWPLHPQALPCWAPVSIKQLFSFLFLKKSLLLRLVLGAKTIAVKTHIATPVIRNMGPDGVMGPK